MLYSLKTQIAEIREQYNRVANEWLGMEVSHPDTLNSLQYKAVWREKE